MVKKRLNKKVALIGSLVFLLLVLVAVVVILRLSRDVETFVQDGDAAWLAKDYVTAERNYLKAYDLARTDELRVEVLTKLADVYIKTDEWPKVRGCWEQIINADPKDLRAQLGRLKYFYIAADTRAKAGINVSGAWKEIESQASGLLQVVEDADLLMQDKAKWEPRFAEEGKEFQRTDEQPVGPYLYLLRGRAAFELARMGAVTNPDESLAAAMNDLKKVQQLDPNNVDAYAYLALAAIEKGQILASRGYLEEKEKAAKQAIEVLEQAVEHANANPRAHINLLTRKLRLAQDSGLESAKREVWSLEPEYLSLADQFPSSPEASAALSEFYSVCAVYASPDIGLATLDKAIEAAEKAVELDQTNVTYAVRAANLYYRKFSVYGQESEIYKAIVVAKNALTLPDAQDTIGPRSYANMANRFSLYSFLASCYIEQILEPSEVRTESETNVWLTNAEQAVHEIEQILGSTEEPQVAKWQGMLELAKGNDNLAIRKLYEAYEQIKASKPVRKRDAHLSYRLAKLFKDTSEVGAATEFFASALQEGIEFTKPEGILDYLEVLGRLDLWSHVISPVNPYNVNAFERNFGQNQRSRTLRIEALIGTNQISEVEEELAKLDPNDPDTIELSLALVQAKIRQVRNALIRTRTKEDVGMILEITEPEETEDAESDASVKLMAAELNTHRKLRAELVQKLLLKEPNSVGETLLAAVCKDYIAQGRTSEAKELAGRFLQYFPDNTAIGFYGRLLSEPDPLNVSRERYGEIEKQVLLSITDPIRRSVQLGLFYSKNNEIEKATEEFKKVLLIEISQEGPSGKPDRAQMDEILQQRLAASYLFDIARQTKDWDLAEQVVRTVRRENMDDCQGQLFAARLAVAKGEFDSALIRIDECLTLRPIFSRAYVLRSNIHAALGNEHASLEDILKAASLNPRDGVIARGLANALYRRDQKLGTGVTSDQVLETERAFINAIRLNPSDLLLLGAYAEYISPREPTKALAILQSIQKNSPTLQNAIVLGRLATQMAQAEKDAERGKVLFSIAAQALEQADTMAPDNLVVLQSYADYYRASGQHDKAKAVLEKSQAQRLLWRHHFQLSQFDEAKEILERLYKSQPEDTDVLKGLLLVSDRTADREGVEKYSEELLSLQDNAENRLDQIKVFLRVGLVKEAEYKLQSFKEKYPEESGVLLLEGWLAMRLGQLKKALELTNRNLEANQDNATAWRLRGEISLLMADYDQAILDLQKSKSLLAMPATRIALAKAYLRTQRVDDAIIELKNTIDEPGAPHEARVLLERIHLGLGRKDELQRFYESTLKKFPKSVLWHNRAGAFAIASGEIDSAEQLYKTAYEFKRDAYRQHGTQDWSQDILYSTAFDGYLRALVLAAGAPNKTGGRWHPEKLDKVFEEAEPYLDTAFASIAYLRMAEAKLILGDREAATEYCRKAVDDAGTNERLASEILLRMFLLLGGDEVSKYCEQKLQTNPNSLAANFTMFNLGRIRRDYDKALPYIDKCIELAGLDTPRGFGYVTKKAELLTLAYDRTSDNDYLKKAIADYESLLAKMPNNSNVQNNLAYMLAENNERLSEALEYAKKAVEQRPNSPSFLDTYAYVLHKNGKNPEADEFLAAALQQYEQSAIDAPPEVYEHLGMIREALGEKDNALDAYKKTLELGGDRLSEKRKERINKAIERLSG